MSEYKSFCATAYLQTGVVHTEPLFLDSILFSIAMQEEYGLPDAFFPGSLQVEPVRIPFAIKETNSQWYYACSQGQWSDPRWSGVDHWTKRFDVGYSDLVDFGKLKAKVIIEQGEYKAYRMPIYYSVAHSLAWYGVGDIGWIRKRLQFIHNIGKKTDQGWGAVLRWDINEIDDDWSCYKEGVAMRPIPSPGGIMAGIRPPYWLKENMTECIIP